MNNKALWLTVATFIITNLLTNLVTHYAIFRGIATSDITGMAAVLASSAVGGAYLGIGWLSVWAHRKLATPIAVNLASNAVSQIMGVDVASAGKIVARANPILGGGKAAP